MTTTASILYAIPLGDDPEVHAARAVSLGAAVLCGGYPSAPSYPCVVIFGAGQSPVFLADDGTLTSTEVSTAAQPIMSALSAAAQAKATALGSLQSLVGQQGAIGAQLQADIATVTGSGWANLTAQQQHDIMLRILGGFGTTMGAISDHLTVNGIG